MFDFEHLNVYQLAQSQTAEVLKFISGNKSVSFELMDQWKRAQLSILLNLAEGDGRVSSSDKKHFFTIARGSVFECVACLQVLNDLKVLEESKYKALYADYESISKMLLGLYRSY